MGLSERSQPLVAQLSEDTMVVVGGEHCIGGLLRSLLIFCELRSGSIEL